MCGTLSKQGPFCLFVCLFVCLFGGFVPSTITTITTITPPPPYYSYYSYYLVRTQLSVMLMHRISLGSAGS